MNLIDGAGFLAGDVGLAVIVAAAALASWLSVPATRRVTDRAPLAMLAVGWTLMGLRMWVDLLTGGDPHIAPAGIVAMSLIGAGQVLFMLRQRKHSWKK